MRPHYHPLHSYAPDTFTPAERYKTAQTHSITEFAFSLYTVMTKAFLLGRARLGNEELGSYLA